MGTDKALLRLQDETLLHRALTKSREISDSVWVVGARERYANLACSFVEDAFPGCGPLAGIHAALQETQHDWNILLSVDTPSVPAAFLRFLVNRAMAAGDVLAVVPNADGGIQGTCAAYRKAFRPIAERQLQAAHYRITEALAQAPVVYIAEEEIRSAGFEPGIFANLNTPEEFENYVRIEETRKA